MVRYMDKTENDRKWKRPLETVENKYSKTTFKNAKRSVFWKQNLNKLRVL